MSSEKAKIGVVKRKRKECSKFFFIDTLNVRLVSLILVKMKDFWQEEKECWQKTPTMTQSEAQKPTWTSKFEDESGGLCACGSMVEQQPSKL